MSMNANFNEGRAQVQVQQAELIGSLPTLITPVSPVHNFDSFERTVLLTGVKFGWKLLAQSGQYWVAFNKETGVTHIGYFLCLRRHCYCRHRFDNIKGHKEADAAFECPLVEFVTFPLARQNPATL